MRRALIIAFAAALGIAATGPAGAAQFGIYAGGSYAQTDRDAERAEFESAALGIYQANGFEPTQTSATFDAKDAAYGFLVGYRMLEHLAVEGGYMDLGEVSYRDRSAGLFDGTLPENWAQNIDSGTSGITFSALAILPLTYRWEVYVRGGLLLASSDADVFITDGIGTARFSATKSGVDLLAGVGTSYSFLEIYSVRLEFQRVFDAGDEETLGEADVDLMTIGVTVAF